MTDDNVSLKTIFVNFDDEVQSHILAGMLSRNISQLYNWAQSGRLLNIKKSDANYKPVTYREVLKHLVDSLVKEDSEFAKYKRQSERRSSRSASIGDLEGDDSIHPLVAAKLQQNIKTEYAREAQLWQSIAIKNEDYVDFSTKLAVVEPFIIQIRDLLLGIALDFPEVQDTIDEGMENLYNLGLRLIEEAKIDREEYVEEMLNKTIKEVEEIE
jgi:hypothetical protein